MIPRRESELIDKAESKLCIYFAILACLCGLTFLGSPEVAALPVIAVFFALFGLIFVDLLGWFSLPSGFAYIALAAISVYAISAFLNDHQDSAEPKMEAVSTLLVLVQSVLMLQRKNIRIFQQLAVFALLQLIVAAIFNNAVTYGFLLIPIAIFAAGGLLFLHVASLNRSSFAEHESSGSLVKVASTTSQSSFIGAVSKLGPACAYTLLPPMLVIGFIFFYGLPRTSDRARHGLGGNPLVGFNENVSLRQIGEMLANPAIAARVTLKERRTKKPYSVMGDLYLRGAVLESYDPNRDGQGSWSVIKLPLPPIMQPRHLPPLASSPGDRNLTAFDDVVVDIDLSPMRGDSLFAVAPYFYDASGSDIVHWPDRWLIARREGPFLRRGSEISYRFLTRGFVEGNLSKFIPRFPIEEQLDNQRQELLNAAKDERGILDSEKALLLVDRRIAAIDDEMDAIESDANAISREGRAQRSSTRYRLEQDKEVLRQWHAREQAAVAYSQACLEYDIDRVPSASLLAKSIVDSMKGNKRDPVRIARSIENYLSTSQRFSYTLNLSGESLPGLDPIEQFLSTDRTGNCQFFASAMVLMLRSQGIPARLVVGFNTDEYNSVGGYYVARQLHAHAWVEALIDAAWVSQGDQYDGDPKPLQYWMRLDPTPGGGGTNLFAGGSVEDMFDMVQQKWTRYVVDADAGDRRAGMSISSRDMSNSYQLYYEWLKLKISRIRAGELGAGAFADRSVFSWPIALASAALMIGIVVFFSLLRPAWAKRNRKAMSETALIEVSRIAYFAEALRLLESLGFKRRQAQTAHEFTTLTGQQLDAQPKDPELGIPLASALSELTAAFYLDRFGSLNEDGRSGSQGDIASNPEDAKIQAALARIRARVEQKQAIS